MEMKRNYEQSTKSMQKLSREFVTTTFATITNNSFVDCTVSFHAIFRYAVFL